MSGKGSGAKDGVCQQCGERLSLVKRMKNETFCSLKCRNEFFGFDDRLVLERLRPVAVRRPALLVTEVPVGKEPIDEAVPVEAASTLPAPQPVAATEFVEPPLAGFSNEVTAKAIAAPSAFSEGALGSLPPLLDLVRPLGRSNTSIYRGPCALREAGTFLFSDRLEVSAGTIGAMLQVAPHPLSTLGEPRPPVSGLGIVEFGWQEAADKMSTPPHANWLEWTWLPVAVEYGLVDGEMEPCAFTIPPQVTSWLRPNRAGSRSTWECLAAKAPPRPVSHRAGIWPTEDEEDLTWSREPLHAKPLAEPPMVQVPVPAVEESRLRLAEGDWVEVPAEARDDRNTANQRNGEGFEEALVCSQPRIPDAGLRCDLPGLSRVLPEDEEEILVPFLVVDNTFTQALRGADQDVFELNSVPPTNGVLRGSLDLPPAGVAVNFAPPRIELACHWQDAPAIAVPVVCAFQAGETWDAI